MMSQAPPYAEFLDDYFAECDEHLKVVRRNLLAIEPFVSQPPADRALLDELFRSLHTIKGLSAMVGLEPAEQLAHEMESCLRALRDERLHLSAEMLDVLLAGARMLEAVLAAYRAQQPLPDVSALVKQLAAFTPAGRPSSPPTPPPTPAPTADTGARLAAALRDGARAWLFEFVPSADLAARGIGVDAVRARLQAIGELVSAAPRVSDGQIIFEFVVAGPQDEAAFAGWQRDGLTWAPYTPPPPPPPAAPPPAPAPSLLPSNVVRVDLARLDDLLQMVGELVVSRARLEENLRAVEAHLPTAQWRALQEVNLTLERQLRDLREGAMRVRMVPIGEVFERMQFVVRDLAREHRQQVNLVLSGQHTEIDKLMVERIHDPLLHLVRNAVSHGLETADERIAQGKPAEGRLWLRASTVGDTVVIEVEDDGRGLDPALIAAKAQELGLLPAGAILDQAGLLDLICAPGFSTRDQADRASGRGVGMSVVKDTVDELGGTLRLDTKPGRGTRFTIQLPLTLAIVDALIVSVGSQTFAVPLPAVREVIEVAPEAITTAEKGRGEMILYRGGVLPLLRLADFFRLEPQRRRAWHVFVLGSEDKRVGVVVDRILGQREVVVRAIADPLARVPGIAAATELGDGRPILILDAGALTRVKRET